MSCPCLANSLSFCKTRYLRGVRSAGRRATKSCSRGHNKLDKTSSNHLVGATTSWTRQARITWSRSTSRSTSARAWHSAVPRMCQQPSFTASLFPFPLRNLCRAQHAPRPLPQHAPSALPQHAPSRLLLHGPPHTCGGIGIGTGARGACHCPRHGCLHRRHRLFYF